MKKRTDAIYDFSTSNIRLPDWWGSSDKEFGYFSENGMEYIITALQTPRPWLNYLGNDQYGLVFGNHGQGFSWFGSMTTRVTRYTTKEYVPRDTDSGRAVYISLRGGESLISIANPPERSSYSCVHGLGYSTISSEVLGVKAQWKIFVPVDDPIEIWQISLCNTTEEVKKLDVKPVLEWHLGQYLYSPPCSYNPASDLTKDIVADFSQQQNVFIVRNTVSQPLKYNSFFKSLEKVDNWQCKRAALLGDDILDLKRIDFTNESAKNEPAVSALNVNVTLDILKALTREQTGNSN